MRPIDASTGGDAVLEPENELRFLLLKERQAVELDGFPSESRCEAVKWILKLTTHHSFSAVTALLAVDYFDRFMLGLHGDEETPWLTRLLSVACLSLASKFQEPNVPPAFDLQLEDWGYNFDSRTIQRMELRVLSNLEWRMNPVTPLCFIESIARKVGLEDFFALEFIRLCEVALLSIVSDPNFVLYPPSVMAAATMSYVVHTSLRMLPEFKNNLLKILEVNQHAVDECLKLYLTETAPESPTGMTGILSPFSVDTCTSPSPSSSLASLPEDNRPNYHDDGDST